MMEYDQQSLTEDEIDRLIASLDTNKDGCVSRKELEAKLDDVYEQLRPHVARKTTSDAADVERADVEERRKRQRHDFLTGLLGRRGKEESEADDGVSVAEFKAIVRFWRVPSLEQERREESEEAHYLDKVSRKRKLIAWWKVVGPEMVFMALVVALQLGLGIWQCLKYALGQEYQSAFGWGVALAKFSAGALYPTVFFLLLSMSRWWSTGLRRFYYVSRFINWDHSQAFHILMSVEALALATLHAIGHLSGTFNWGSRADRQDAVGALLGQDAVPRSYVDYVRSLPGASGLTALGVLYVISLMSMPVVRRRSYEAFQAAHLLMFPFIGLLMCHGARRLLQFPVMGFVLALPTLLILAERATRLIRSFIRIPATISILDDETVCIKCDIPSARIWPYEAGQYVFLQVPALSMLQWHPFTISYCVDREMQLHIKTDGDWTSKLRTLASSEKDTLTDIAIGIDGPFGAPAQRFYDFDQAIIVGAGIGITPFSAILNDLQAREDHRWSSGVSRSRRRSASRSRSTLSRTHSATSLNATSAIAQARARIADRGREAQKRSNGEEPNALSRHPSILPNKEHIDLTLYRRVDMHWIVRDKNHLLWFSDLLNEISQGKGHLHDHLDVNVFNHVTRKHDDISLHVFRWLLERHRGEEGDQRSPFTGLYAPTHFGRPKFPRILHSHYDQMKHLFEHHPARRRRIGVFFCGAPVIGVQLADLCAELTRKGVKDQSGVEYHFQMEVFT